MSVKEQLDTVLKTLEDAVLKHLEEERLRINKLREVILVSAQQLNATNAKDKSLIDDITYATGELDKYKPLEFFNDLYKGGKRMKRSRRSNRKSVRK